MPRKIYVISDLHIGGANPKVGERRGFKLCTHTQELAAFITTLAYNDADCELVELVINGDIVDFLAETAEEDAVLVDKPTFSAFNFNVQEAITKLDRIIAREREVFQALYLLLDRGHMLTLNLGNHDIELAIPQVRAHFEKAIGAADKRFKFLHDGEAYTIGNSIIIEHGNDYDEWNRVHFNNLRELRAAYSRNVFNKHQFRPPKGSILVEKLMNPQKLEFRFIDLLKPEQEAVIPILLALKPSLYTEIDDAIRIYLSDWRDKFANLTGIGSRGGGEVITERSLAFNDPTEVLPELSPANEMLEILPKTEDMVMQELEHTLGSSDAANEFMESLKQPMPNSDLEFFNNRGGGTFTWLKSVTQLLFGNKEEDRAGMEQRLPTLLRALRTLKHDKSFAIHQETLKGYHEAAERLIRYNGYKYVVFGHTHFARNVDFGNGTRYFNTGTWADLMRLPDALFSDDEALAMAAIRRFVDAIKYNNFDDYIRFYPHYVCFTVNDNNEVMDAALKMYK